jgi:multiple sugar transport system ATP-binding protein
VSFLELEKVEKTYPDGTRAVRGIDLSIGEGEFIVLLGPSGCGKTTTLRMIAGLELATAGSIKLAGRDVTQLRPSERDVGMVFQFYALYPHLSARQNIEFPLRCSGVGEAEIRSRVDAVVEQMNLRHLIDLHPRQLSGGDQQKVSLARAIVRRPLVYLMDEPLGTLDSDQRQNLRELIRARQLELKVTTIYVTHDQEEAMSLADRIVVMEGGKIRQVGTPAEVYDRPADLFVANFVGSPGMNLIPGKIESDGSAFVPEGSDTRVGLPRSFKAGAAKLGIRSEHVRADGSGPIVGRVVTEEYLGITRNVHLQADFGRVIMQTEATLSRERGSEVRIGFDPEHVVLFDAESGAHL